MTRRLSITALALAAAWGLVGVQASLHAQGIGTTTQTAPQTVAAQTAPETRASLRDWQFPGMQIQTDDGYPKVAMVTGVAVGSYSQVLDFYAKKMSAVGYAPKGVTQFQPVGHSIISGMGMNFEGSGSCYADSQSMHATMCRRFEHEAVTVSLSEDRQSSQIHIALTDATF